ncbi:MAG TPA: hypothetical protein VMV92_45150 [Streptosporangiaceae bacterium]|nr:hypothetical protein [Streptosporangiaceae bacterium]
MGPAALAAFGILVLFVGALVGWHARRAYGAHGDMKVSKARVPTFRRTRNRGVLVAAALVIVCLLVIKALA